MPAVQVGSSAATTTLVLIPNSFPWLRIIISISYPTFTPTPSSMPAGLVNFMPFPSPSLKLLQIKTIFFFF